MAQHTPPAVKWQTVVSLFCNSIKFFKYFSYQKIFERAARSPQYINDALHLHNNVSKKFNSFHFVFPLYFASKNTHFHSGREKCRPKGTRSAPPSSFCRSLCFRRTARALPRAHFPLLCLLFTFFEILKLINSRNWMDIAMSVAD